METKLGEDWYFLVSPTTPLVDDIHKILGISPTKREKSPAERTWVDRENSPVALRAVFQPDNSWYRKFEGIKKTRQSEREVESLKLYGNSSRLPQELLTTLSCDHLHD